MEPRPASSSSSSASMVLLVQNQDQEAKKNDKVTDKFSIKLFGKMIELDKKSDEDRKKNLGLLVVKKELMRSDIDSSSRLLLPKQAVLEHMIPRLNGNDAQLCTTTKGATITIYDADTNSWHRLVLKQWKTKSFVCTGNWTQDFVRRRNLQQKDEIGLFWDENNLRFNFSVLKKG